LLNSLVLLNSLGNLEGIGFYFWSGSFFQLFWIKGFLEIRHRFPFLGKVNPGFLFPGNFPKIYRPAIPIYYFFPLFWGVKGINQDYSGGLVGQRKNWLVSKKGLLAYGCFLGFLLVSGFLPAFFGALYSLTIGVRFDIIRALRNGNHYFGGSRGI